ncbi:hypothetical protein FHT44_005050 [Mycolicibacterium sp. BK634]|nr:hypothetical protein [Mycolicibacterium sp. BK634]
MVRKRETESERLRRLIDDVKRAESDPRYRTGYDHWELSDDEGSLWSFFSEHRELIYELMRTQELAT